MTDSEPTACQLTGLDDADLARAVAKMRKLYDREGWIDPTTDPVPTDAEWRLAVGLYLEWVLRDFAEDIARCAFGPRPTGDFGRHLDGVIERREKATA